ncbi:molybdopterin-dependent oxidoreductase [Clostridium sp. PL3]|uniref:Molybdopterin-dependent oxidoreductase n=1 Tax=Clostridium thailandense TaxID=2794346 RepID=A0A949TN81_9CLOT|nr:molybdopterin-dependent oxidoreductase [Clostridium thailandense]MBV7275505.1 molybdopterin-dependent oxidoreductase [Clostridium thailandense]
MEVLRSVCPYDCPDTCGLIINVEDGKVIKVQGDPEHPFTRGTLCPKMAHYEKTVHSKKRILTPLLRNGAKGSGRFEPISWDKAIKHIATKWKEIIVKYGSEAILPYSYAGTMGLVQRNSGHPFFYSIGASRLDRTICAPAKQYGWDAVMGKTMGPHTDEIQESDLIILWGIHALATDIHIIHDINIAKKKGAKVWLIDTFETDTAKIADKVIIVKPGTDGALALGMMNVIARDNLIDKNFINKYVQGYEELKDNILKDYPLDKVNEITGIDASVIENMAIQYGKAKAPFIRMGSGLSRYGNGAMSVRTITCLPALVGAWGKRGGGLLTSTSTSSAFDKKLVTREEFQKKEARIINMNELGNALNEVNDPPIMSLYVYHSNPAAVAPDQNKVLKGLSREDLFTVVHERFMTDTAKYADIVLPATTSLEHSDLYNAYGHYVVQRAYPAISTLGEAKSNWEVFSLLADAMDINKSFFNQSADELINSILEKSSSWLANTKIEALLKGKPLELPLPDGYKTNFRTPSGKIEILNPAEDEPLPRYFEPHGDNAEFWLINSPDPRLLNSSFNEREDLIKDNRMILQVNPEDASKIGIEDGKLVTAYNERGEVDFKLKITNKVPKGVVVTQGVWWIENTPGNRSVNALTSQRLTDKGNGSTFYDVKINIKAKK